MDMQAQRGFTLWELLGTLAVAGIVLGLGVPSFIEFQRNNAMVAAANELVGAVSAARAEAVKRQVPVTLCANSEPMDEAPECDDDGAPGAGSGFIVWVDDDGDAVLDAGEQLLLQRPAPGGAIGVQADSGYIVFGPAGFPVRTPPAGAQVTTVLFCDDRGNSAIAGGLSAARVVRIDATGRAQAMREIADVTDALAALGAGATCP